MIKKFICWLWGHKLHTEVKTETSTYQREIGGTHSSRTSKVKAKFCERCGCKL